MTALACVSACYESDRVYSVPSISFPPRLPATSLPLKKAMWRPALRAALDVGALCA